MRFLLIFMAVAMLAGCAYNETTIMSAGDVYCTSNVDKPVSVTPSVQADGNTVPIAP
jgi:uncharacterized lipoprotein YajG